ncbi:MAG: hypothetical protein ACLVJ8_09240 [Ruthenibacterium lactatiformans]
MVGRFSGRRVGCLLRLCTRPFRHAPGCRSGGALAPARLPARFCCRRRHARGRAFAGRFFLLGERLWPPCASPEKRLAAAVPVKTGGLLLDGFFEAGFTLFLVRPLAALRPHYLLTPPGLRQPAPGTPDEDAVRRVHIPLADTLAVSRLLEQGFCGTALYDGADGQPALRLERPNPA